MPTLLKEHLDEILINTKSSKDDFDCFVETGTYMGETILRYIDDFHRLYTIELSEKFFKDFNQQHYNRKKLTSLLGDSSKLLFDVVKELKSNTIFFLDGHFSSCGTASGEKDVPLNEELQIINDSFIYECLIIVDDLRLFGTKGLEDWSYISVEKLTSIVEKRLLITTQLNDRLILKLKKIE